MMKFVVFASLMVAVASAAGPGVELFSGFLAAHPDIKAEFPKFRDVANDQLASNPDLIAHAGKIANIVDSLPTRTDWTEIDELSGYHKGM